MSVKLVVMLLSVIYYMNINFLYIYLISMITKSTIDFYKMLNLLLLFNKSLLESTTRGLKTLKNGFEFAKF